MGSLLTESKRRTMLDECLLSPIWRRYSFKKHLFPSHYGFVLLAHHLHDKRDVVIKVSSLHLISLTSSLPVENVKREAFMMQYLHDKSKDDDDDGGKYVVKLIEEYCDENYHFLVMEYAEHGDLYSVIMKYGALGQGAARTIFRQICRGLQFLHKHHIAHVDFSLENVCLSSDGRIRLIDLGLAAAHPEKLPMIANRYNQCVTLSKYRHHHHDHRNNEEEGFPCQIKFSRPGKLGYMSPELYNVDSAKVDDGSFQSSTTPSKSDSCGVVADDHCRHPRQHHNMDHAYWDAYANDIFGLGVILFCLLAARRPFDGATSDDVCFHRMYTGEWLQDQYRLNPANGYSHIDSNALHLINAIIKPQHQRPSIQQILRHPWLNHK